MSDIRFEEKILYKTRQHWIVPVLNSCKWMVFLAFPLSLGAYFLSNFSLFWTITVFLMVALCVIFYDHYLWHHSWLMIGNQKVTLSVRNGIFSQYAMNIRYRNIRDCAVSKNTIFGYIFKYGTLFMRASSGSDGDFQARYVPKVGKVYALINALSRYDDDDRSSLQTIEELHNHHLQKEFSHKNPPEKEILTTLREIPGITHAVELSSESREYILSYEEARNHGIFEVLKKQKVYCILHNDHFRPPQEPLIKKNAHGEIFFPSIPFPEAGKGAISASPSTLVHSHLLSYFPYAHKDDASILIGVDS